MTIVFGFVFVGVISTCALTIGIWPGEIKLLAPFFCTDAQPDPFVVSDTTNPQPGETVTNFSLYCMGPRGDATDHGFFKPFLLMSLFHGLIFLFLMFVGIMTSAARQARRMTPDERAALLATSDDTDEDRDDVVDALGYTTNSPPPGSTAGPFVD